MEFGYNFAEPFFFDNDYYVDYSVNDFNNSVLRFAIDDNHQMNAVMDRMRTEDGHLPMFPEDECCEYDCDGWYNFYIVVEKTGYGEYSVSIEATVISESAEDNEQCYAFTLPEDVQKTIIDRLDELCWRHMRHWLQSLFYEYEYEKD